MRAALLLGAGLLAGCPSDTSTDTPDSDTEVVDTEPASTFGPVKELFTRSCTSQFGCHDGPEPNSGLDLRPSHAYDMLVGVASTAVPTMVRIDPGSVETSLLWHKVNGTSDTVGDLDGEAMPPPFGLGGSDLDVIRAWIEAGAPND